MDPVGDKVLLVSIYLVMGLREAVPRWVMWLVLGRDALILAMVAIAFFFTSVRSFPPSIWGKLSTIIQVTGALYLLVSHAFFFDRVALINDIVVASIAAVTVWSGVHYLWVGCHRFRALVKSPSY